MPTISLHSEQGAALLTDFGASSFIAPDDPQQAHALQRLEARAFACLLEELLARCTPTADATQAQAQKTMSALKAACLQENPDQRPLFAQIEQVLRTLEQQTHDLRCDSSRGAQGSDQLS